MDLVEYTGRLFRQGKASISAELAGIFERLGSQRRELADRDGEAWRRSFAGPFLCGQRREATGDRRTLGVRRLVNLVDVQFDDTILNRGSHRIELSPVDRPVRAE